MSDDGGDELLEKAIGFGDDVVRMLRGTICPDAELEAEISGTRVSLTPPKDDKGKSRPLLLTIGARQLLELRLHWWLMWDHQGRYLKVYESQFAIADSRISEPLVRVEYDSRRDYLHAHIQVHAESSTVGYLQAFHPSPRPPDLARLHLPVGDARFRPCLEDLVEMLVKDLSVDPQHGWETLVESGRGAWKASQTKAAVRDLLRVDPGHEADLLRTIADAVSSDDGR